MKKFLGAFLAFLLLIGSGLPASAAEPSAQAVQTALQSLGAWVRTPEGGRMLASQGLGRLEPLTSVMQATKNGRAVATVVARRLAETDPEALGRLSHIAQEAPEEAARILAELSRAHDSARADFLKYALLVSRMARADQLGRRELGQVRADFEALREVFDDAAYLRAFEDVDARRNGGASAPSAPIKKGLRAKARARADSYRLGAMYLRLGKSAQGITRLEMAADAGHIGARRLLSTIPGAHAAERLPSFGAPWRPDVMLSNLGQETKSLKYWTPLAAAILSTSIIQLTAGIFLHKDLGFMSIPHRAILGAIGFYWAYHEWKTRSSKGWSWWIGFKNGLRTLAAAALWMIPFSVLGAYAQGHDPVPATVQHFGGYWRILALMPLLVPFEEVFFRMVFFVGMLQAFQKRLARKNLAFFLAAGISSALFGLMHQQYNPLLQISVAILGYFMALSYYRTRWLWVPIAFHLYLDFYAVGVRLLLSFFGVHHLW